MTQHTGFHISRMTGEHNDWLRALEFYKEELEILKNRLSEVSTMYSKEEVKADVEHYQNQFIIQRNNIDELTHSINEHANHMNQNVQDMAQHLSSETMDEHTALHEKFQNLEHTIVELKHNFYRFVAKYI